MTQAYPLQWPAGWPRSRATKSASFGKKQWDSSYKWQSHKELTVADARQRLADELDRLNARYVTLSTNMELRLDGQPRSDRRDPDDVGVAVYFQLNGKQTVLACDKWNRVADNIAAIAKHIEALRGMDRWGVGTAAQAFAGYQALPAPEQWWQVLGVSSGATKEQINAAYRALAMKAHSDTGGSDAEMARLNVARDQGLAA